MLGFVFRIVDQPNAETQRRRFLRVLSRLGFEPGGQVPELLVQVYIHTCTIVATQPGAFGCMLGMYLHLCASEMLDMVLHTYIHIHTDIHTYIRTYIHACRYTAQGTTTGSIMNPRVPGLRSTTASRTTLPFGNKDFSIFNKFNAFCSGQAAQ